VSLIAGEDAAGTTQAILDVARSVRSVRPLSGDPERNRGNIRI
jgi:hypothetical protein